MNFKKIFITVVLAALCLSAVVGISVLILGSFGKMQSKILATTAVVGIYSMLALSCSTVYFRSGLRAFSIIGMTVACVALLLALLGIWETAFIANVWKGILMLGLSSLGFAHISLLLLIPRSDKLIKVGVGLTILFIVIGVLLGCIIISEEFGSMNLLFRILGVFLILDVLGSIMIPVLHLTRRKSSP